MAFETVAHHLALLGNDVTVLGTAPPRNGRAYTSLTTRVVPRETFERFPSLPPVARSPYTYEEISFIPGLIRHFDPSEYDVTMTCSYPYTNWVLRSWGRRDPPQHVFVTHNGDWPAHSDHLENRLFSCDGLVCINPEYFERNRDRWRSVLIPNGVDHERFHPGPAERERFGLPRGAPIVLVASALIPSKRVEDAIRVVAQADDDAILVVAGDGPERVAVDALANHLLPGRFTRLVVKPDDMPSLYRSVDLLLHLSKDEAFGLIYIEALASGLPVVAHETPTTRWILGDDAVLIDTTILEDAASAVREALDSGTDVSAARAARCGERFAWERVATQYEAFLDEVVSTTPRQRSGRRS